MLKNIPSAASLNEMALRLYFDAWDRTIGMVFEFEQHFDIFGEVMNDEHQYWNEWLDYLEGAQSEMGAISATIQNSAELRLKSIICDVNPVLLILNGNISFKTKKGEDIDFANLRTLDAVDLLDAVKSMTDFEFPDTYVEQYGRMRRMRNRFTHLGSHEDGLTPRNLIEIMVHQYISLWPDGRWLFRRVCFDGSSAKRFFHDERHSSIVSNIMIEMDYNKDVINNFQFKKMFGYAKGKLKFFCTSCMSRRATKWHDGACPTVVQIGKNKFICLMCEDILNIIYSDEKCDSCKPRKVNYPEDYDVCFECGMDRY